MKEDLKEAYSSWFNSHTVEEQAVLKKQGLDKPLVEEANYKPDYTVTFSTVGEDTNVDEIDDIDETDTIVAKQIDDKAKAYGSQMLTWVFLRLAECKTAEDMMLTRDSLLFALGLQNLLDYKTETEAAKRYDLTRAAISSRVKDWQELLGLKASPCMKSDKACKAYRKARLANLTSNN